MRWVRLAGEVGDELLLAALESPTHGIRLEAAWTLARHGDCRAAESQIAVLRNRFVSIKEEQSEYVLETDIPLSLLKEERRLDVRIAELKQFSELASHPDQLAELDTEKSRVELNRRFEELYSLQDQLAEAEEDLGLMRERKAQYAIETNIPAHLVEQERRLAERIGELQRRSDLLSLQDQLVEAQEDLLLIEERKAMYYLEADISLQLIKNEQQTQERISELKRRIENLEQTSDAE
jgi:hypothetical protein